MSKKYWRAGQISDLELFAAHFKTHKYRRHIHEGYVIGVVTHGLEAFYCRGQVHTAGPGDVILVNPQSQHDGEAASDAGWSYRVMYPSEAHFLRVQSNGIRPYFAKSVVHDPNLASRIARLHKGLESQCDTHEMREIWAGILLDLVERHAERPATEDYTYRDPKRIALIEQILRASCIDGIGLEEVADEVGWSQWHLIRSFKAAKGISPHDFLVDCRIRHAKGLIDDGEGLAAAAVASGFVDQSHFTRHFTRAYGFTPGAYRRSRS
ncbi:AraC family transcriptional regulator [uncultured Roseobacter sp.]|uniref:AraC family transcriptional regulator n=1 Tax=uncultured Roseobacter sp. TaxID=114847 RepID=UPI00261C0B2E|nr:AraC family transcriptional regulator [uncultured Roseobacter sp.]